MSARNFRVLVPLLIALASTGAGPTFASTGGVAEVNLHTRADVTDDIKVLADGTRLVLTTVGGERILQGLATSGSNHAGCSLSAYNNLGWVIYSFTTWQDYDWASGAITYFPPESVASLAYWGWSITSSSHSHWWVSNPTRAAARGEYTFTQYVAGQPYQSRSGYVQVNINGNGTWTCSSS